MNSIVKQPPGARAVLAAATELFARAGYESVSVADIAEKAHVCKANIFHHFESKEVLYLDVMRQACQGHAEFTEALHELDLSSTEKLRRLIAFELEDMFSNEQRSQLIFREILNAGCSQGRRLAEEVFSRNYTAVAALFLQGQARGEFRADLDMNVAAWMLGASTMMFFQNRDIIPHLPGFGAAAEPKVYAERVFETVLRGLATGVGDAARTGSHEK